MVKPPVCECVYVIFVFLVCTGFYGSLYLIKQSGSIVAKLAVETNERCLSLKSKENGNVAYEKCALALDILVKNLLKSGEINPNYCNIDDTDSSVVECPVWVWFVPRLLPFRDINYLNLVAEKRNGKKKDDTPFTFEQIATAVKVLTFNSFDKTKMQQNENLKRKLSQKIVTNTKTTSNDASSRFDKIASAIKILSTYQPHESSENESNKNTEIPKSNPGLEKSISQEKSTPLNTTNKRKLNKHLKDHILKIKRKILKNKRKRTEKATQINTDLKDNPFIERELKEDSPTTPSQEDSKKSKGKLKSIDILNEYMKFINKLQNELKINIAFQDIIDEQTDEKIILSKLYKLESNITETLAPLLLND